MILEHTPFVLIVSSPSGTGKTSLCRGLIKSESHLRLSVSWTTRPRREGEEDGKDYFFASLDEFQEKESEEGFLETAFVFGHWYGTPKSLVEENQERGLDTLLDIDWQGAAKVHTQLQEKALRVFLLPPSRAALLARLALRGRDPEDVIALRMQACSAEMEHYKSYDYVLVNEDFSECLESLLSILRAERHKRIRKKSLAEFVHRLQKRVL